MKNAFKLEKLEAMSADELEQYRDRGREYRVMLNCAVLSQLAVPEGWHVVAEEGCEFCGCVPVVCRISPAGDEATALYLCSSGAEVPNWSMALPFDGGQSLAWLYLDERYTPAMINRVLHTVAGYYRLGFWRPEKLAVALRMGGHCL
ncbi:MULTISPECIES: conjugation system SOS inhibitor PsiB [Serratia]|uniref:conjugation system SOS inhibitor PsiB n=1 Tax=Serratia TaxID=613 RepID=UPI001BD22502|nr:conjugation system SOS inhibitor PsiB [Serratia marcescens]EIG9090311.1 conjugation system SOS inhibitor PsiB [Serratia marcescens]CAI1966101.1 plasmid SOS inhibition protein B [Serratia marcescens]